MYQRPQTTAERRSIRWVRFDSILYDGYGCERLEVLDLEVVLLILLSQALEYKFDIIVCSAIESLFVLEER